MAANNVFVSIGSETVFPGDSDLWETGKPDHGNQNCVYMDGRWDAPQLNDVVCDTTTYTSHICEKY